MADNEQTYLRMRLHMKTFRHPTVHIKPVHATAPTQLSVQTNK